MVCRAEKNEERSEMCMMQEGMTGKRVETEGGGSGSGTD